LHLLHIFEGLERSLVNGWGHRASTAIYDEPILFNLDWLVEWNMRCPFGLLLSRKSKDGAAGE
jgi:hypothetical protein